MGSELVRSLMTALDDILLPPLLARPQHYLAESDRLALTRAVWSGEPIPQQCSRQIAATVAASSSSESMQTLTALLPQLASIYRECFHMGASFGLRPTAAYTGTPEFCVIATRTIRAGTDIAGLEAVLVPFVGELTPRTTRSMVKDEKRGGNARLMGPLSRVNHDCRAFTAKFQARRDKIGGFQVIRARAVRDIQRGEEVTINYGGDFFGDDNEDCLCRSDELDRRNGWKSGRQQGDAVHREKSRSATAARKRALESAVFSYRPWTIPEGPRRPGDYARALSTMPSNRCIALHCRMQTVDLPFGSMCAGCEQQALATSETTSDALQRYFGCLARGHAPLGLYHTRSPVAAAAEYLDALEIEGWQVYPKPIRFNSKDHKARCVQEVVNPSESRDLASSVSCNSAAADGGRQSGQIWLTVGEWRPDEANNLVEFREVTRTLYASILLLRNRKMYLMDPCFAEAGVDGGHGEEPRVVRLGELRSLHRARTLIDALTKGKRRVNISDGIAIGSWRPLQSESEFDLSFFACYELLEEMKINKRLREAPEAWAREVVRR